MKNRTFLLGLGVGLIAGALLLQIMLIGQGTASSQLLTAQQVKEAAQRFNLKVYDEAEKVYTAQEWEAKPKEAKPGEQTSPETKKPVEPKAPSSTTDPAKPDSASAPKEPAAPDGVDKSSTAPDTPKTTTPKQTEAPKKPETISFKISSGDTLSKVADNLKKSGIIDDKSAFIQKAVDKKSNYRLQTGTYSFEEGESAASIISKITSKPSGK
ncbi:endolytic transglycosylase MltG [Paenibacillus sp. J22TS3]|uniref:endolytic transglycosylase MltG n=1 Tax=Paenibacillus sp. J22TS3 TaxID=2807192 RepID=UPI001B2A3303|nr:endolytic transglycosylase MltG [Paenibacillus sp. J22TS3]GIP21455.1 hypothetical protein J22TS3_17300 [Paenibacillus sp. J22TS3]